MNVDEYNKRQEAKKVIYQEQRNAIRNALQKCGITEVTARYSGFNDQGQVDTVETIPELLKEAVLNVAVVEYCDYCQKDKTIQKQKDIRETLLDFFHEILEHEYSGWENDGGADGAFTWNIAKDKIALSHTGYVTESHYEEKEL